MNSEPFHVTGQEWRYHPREKSLLHTLHLAQIPDGMSYEGVAIPVMPVPNNGSFSGAGVPPLQLPSAPNISATIFNTFTQIVGSSVYGCVSFDQSIPAQRNCGITIDSWTSSLMQVTMNPNKAGKFLLHLECQTDLRTLGYQGPAGDGQCHGEIIIDGGGGSVCNMQIKMNGGVWSATLYLESVGHSATTFIDAVTSQVIFKGYDLGDPSAAIPAHISCFILKVDGP